MKVASGLAAGMKPPELASATVNQALAKAELTQAGTVLLFLTRDFQRQPQPALLAAARAGCGSMEIFGTTALRTDHRRLATRSVGRSSVGHRIITGEQQSSSQSSAFIHRPRQHPAFRLAGWLGTRRAARQRSRSLGAWPPDQRWQCKNSN